jgi:flagellar hook protein FlgE
MGISSALFSGVSGLNTLGNSMAVIGDNIANVNTIGFKSSRSTFETVLAQSVAGASGTSQVGRGVALSAVDANFSQGSFETTSEPTDMAIGGKGFFMVRSPDDSIYYTRAGHFSFDVDGFLVNPADLRVQGFLLEPITGEIEGGRTDIFIDVTRSSPNPTDVVNISANLDAAAEILDTGASVDSGQDSTSGFIFNSGENDVLNFLGGDLSIIGDGGLDEGRVYSGAEVAAALETALGSVIDPNLTVVYDSTDATDPNTFYITNNSGTDLTVENDGSINNALGINTAFTVTNGDANNTQDSREFYVEPGVNDTFEITVDNNPITGQPVLVRIEGGNYTGDELASKMEENINNALMSEGVSVDVRYDESNPFEKVFRITSSSRGTGTQIDLDPGTDNFLATVKISEYDSVTEGSGITSGGFTESADPVNSSFLITNGNANIAVGGGVSILNGAGGLTAGGYYTGEEIAAALTANMPAAGLTGEVVYLEGQDSFTIENTGPDFTIDWATSSAVDVLGFTGGTSQTVTAGAGLIFSTNATAFNIIASQNDSLQITVDGSTGGPVNVTIDPGVYTGESLASLIESGINDALLSNAEPGRVEVSYFAADGNFKIESSSLGSEGAVQLNGTPASNPIVSETLGITDFTLNNGTGFQVDAPDDTSNYSTSLSVYDSLGAAHTLSIYFRKATESDNAATWEWFAYVPAGDTQSGEPEAQARGQLTFNNAGILTAETPVTYLTPNGDGFNFRDAAPDQPIDIDFGFEDSTNVTTQFSSPSSTIFQTQDGYGSGSLQDVSVGPDGKITGNYSNGQVLYQAQIALANFTNPWGLSREGGNNYARTNDSGDALEGPPGVNGLGRISPNSLEQSNVDLSTEFVNMIIQQRGFQANSKIITTTDSMLAELINLKR